MIPIDLSRFGKHTSGKWVVRKKVDDSGDYVIYEYDVLAHYDWGDNAICYGISNPYDAELFASGPELINEIRELRERVAFLEAVIKTGLQCLDINPELRNQLITAPGE